MLGHASDVNTSLDVTAWHVTGMRLAALEPQRSHETQGGKARGEQAGAGRAKAFRQAVTVLVGKHFACLLLLLFSSTRTLFEATQAECPCVPLILLMTAPCRKRVCGAKPSTVSYR